MNIFLYCSNPKNPSEIPVWEYFIERYGEDLDIKSEKTRNDLAGILSKWKYVKDNNGRPDEHYARKQSGFDFIEIHIKKSKVLIRFPYCINSAENKMIILMGYEKPEIYKTKGKIANEVKKKKVLGQKYYEDYQNDKRKAIKLDETLNDFIDNL